jgi:integrase
MESSGLGPSDTLNLTPNKIDFKSDPVAITIQRQMTDHVFTTFISKEAATALNQYIKEKGAMNPEEKIFNFSATRLLTTWRKASEIAGYEKIRLFELRRFFHKILCINGTQEFIINFLMGFQQNLEKQHIEITKEPLREEYKKVEPNLTIFT